MSKKTEFDHVRRLFPELEQIKDEKIRRNVVEVWLRLWKESPFKNIEDCPKDKVVLLVSHTRATASCAIECAKIVEREHGATINCDYLIAASLLHDADVMLSYKIEGGKMVKGPFPYFPHGVHTAIKALEVGLPREIAHIVLIHSPQLGTMKPQPPVVLEYQIMSAGDKASAEVVHAM